jgi:hypothetical protein
MPFRSLCRLSHDLLLRNPLLRNGVRALSVSEYSASLGGADARPVAALTGTKKQGRKLQQASKGDQGDQNRAPGPPDTDIVVLHPGSGAGLDGRGP